MRDSAGDGCAECGASSRFGTCAQLFETLLALDHQRLHLVGTLNFNSIIRGAFQSASIAYWVSQDRNGEGFASAAVADAKQIAADRLGLHRLQAETLVDNEASQRVLVKNGFVQYGQAPEYLKIAGRWQEHRLFQVTFRDG